MKIKNMVTVMVMVAAAAAGGWFAASSRNASVPAPLERAGQAQEAKEAGHDDHADEEKDHKEGEEGHEGHGHGTGPDSGEFCAEHRMPEAEDALCNPDLINSLASGKGIKVRLATPEAAARAGVVSVLPIKSVTATGPTFPAQAVYSRKSVAQVAALTSGIVRRLHADVGAMVKKGQVLAEVASTDVSAARSDLTAAQGRLTLAAATLRREEQLFAKGISAQQEVEQARAEEAAAQAAVEQGQQRLALYGSSAKGAGGATVTLRAPIDGVVVERNILAGQSILAETPLFTVVDLATMGVEISLPVDRITLARVGTPIEALFDGMGGERFTGRIVQVGAALDGQTRLFKVLAEVDNSEQLLKSGLFGQVRLLASTPGEALEVPSAAVQMLDGKAFVFIEREADLFELRRVETGPRRGKLILIAVGLAPDEKVVATQGFALKSEVLKSRLGASCADH